MKKVLILSGAGLSAASGLRTFRESGGLWEQYSVAEVCSVPGFLKDRAKVLKFYDERRAQLAGCEPNLAHYTIAKLKKEFGEKIVVQTQNVDDLLERAGCEGVIHLHGFLPEIRCEACGHVQNIGYAPIKGQICEKCKSPKMRHNIVMFGEQAPHYADLYEALQECEMFVCIGTSGEVLDVAGYTRYFKISVLNNLDASRIDKFFDKCYTESAVTAAPKWENDIRKFLQGEAHENDNL
ncbi:MAG: NAD-dependent deacetylase [Campylobacter sp.]|nr:NAD-dependent deacetylase [Campylobacter sp.]